MDHAPSPLEAAEHVFVKILFGGDKGIVLVKLLDDVIRAEYRRFATPVDRLVSDPDLAAEFANMVKARMPADGEMDVASISWRLISLRKRGEDKGGLPRLQRSYYGRETKQSRAPKPR